MTKPEKNKKFIDERFYSLALIAASVSLLGYIVENIWTILDRGYIDNRNMCFPLLFGYGLSMLAVYGLFGTPKEPRFILKSLGVKKLALRKLTYFGLVFICVSAGETLLGYAVEALCGITWWSYEDLPLNIGTYTSIPTSSAFSVMILIFMDLIFSRLYNFFISLNPKLLKILSLSLLLIMTADFINSGLYMLTEKKILRKWKVQIFEKGLLKLIFSK